MERIAWFDMDATDLERFLARAGGTPVLVSACLLGLPTRYDGAGRAKGELLRLAAQHRLVPVCPEQLGGLSTPRQRSTLRTGDGAAVVAGAATVTREDGRDVTESFLRGARAALEIARLTGARFAVLKEKSPSCGVARTYVDGLLVAGGGVAAALLEAEGIEIFAVP